jgi:NitT/TauT family transport system substrate-binding protein
MPMRGCWSAIAAGLLLVSTAIGAAAAEPAEIRVWRAIDLASLPLLVIEHEKLIEKEAEARGLPPVKLHWSAPGKTGPIEAVAAGQTDIAAVDIAPFLIAADMSAGKPQDVRALAALAQRPYVLVARNPAIQTIRDFREADRIAVPALKTSGPALMLEMAAAQEWGADHYDKLDPLAVARPDPAAADALTADKPDIAAHFSRSPYADDELASPGIHRVMDSFDITGAHSAVLLVTTKRFRDANPVLCAAILAALNQADLLIRNNPGGAAETYEEIAKDQDIALEDLTDMIGDPDLAYVAAPAGVMRLAEFMHRIGRLKRRPQSWKDLFFLEAHDLPGS